MKIRQGFVSNSSSSSFVALIPAPEWESIISKIGIIELSVIKKYTNTVNFCGIECIKVHYIRGEYDSFDCLDATEQMAIALGIKQPLGKHREEIKDMVSEARYYIENMIKEKQSKNLAFIHVEQF